ncbi:MAG: LCP family protein [Clostridiales bacterium]|nr:LCP family protein [Clostridiales bacterium]
MNYYDDDDGRRGRRRERRTAGTGRTGNSVREYGRGAKKRRKKRSSAGLFFKVVMSVILLYTAVIGCYIGYTYLNTDETDDFFSGENKVANAVSNALQSGIAGDTNLVVLGTDEEGTRTDTIMVLNYNSRTGKLTLISVPRDSYIEVSQSDFDAMQSEYPEPGSSKMKINHIYHYAPEGEKEEFSAKYVGKLLGLNIDYYALVDFDAFTYLIDSIGGIEYDVPMDMYYYDPEFDFLIDLKAGVQTLNGEQAEQLVRFRKGYSNQDLGRVSTQQSFVKELISELAKKENILSNPTAYIKTAIEYVKTNVGITDAVKYFGVLTSLDTENIASFTVPGTSASIDGVSCYQVDQDLTDYLVKTVKNGTYGETYETVSSEGKDIVVLNGGYTSGLAGTFQSRLTEAGFYVSSIGDFSGLKSDITKIYVDNKGEGQDLQEYFSDSLIIIGEEKPADGDIVVVLGVGET